VQKFTRPLTREIDLAGNRLALTLTDQGISVRPVGARKPPWECSWDQLLCRVTGAADAAAAFEALRKGTPSLQKEAESTTAASPAAPATPAAPAEVASLLGQLEQWLNHHRPRYGNGLVPGASTAQLETMQKEVGLSLPQSLRAWLSWHNGQSDDFIGHFQQDWDLMSAAQIVEAKHALDNGDRTSTGWNPAWIPFLDDDAGDYVCLDTSQPEAPVREFWQGKADHPFVAKTLSSWLADFVGAVERGDYHEDPERGSFLRRS
jgi:cell wall assembly regulator SMI1